MDRQTQSELQTHLNAIAAILFKEADPADLKTLGGIEKSVRGLAQEHVLPQLGIFYRQRNRDETWKNPSHNEYSGGAAPKSVSSRAIACQAKESLESIPRALLSLSECQCLLSASRRRYRGVDGDNGVPQHPPASGAASGVAGGGIDPPH